MPFIIKTDLLKDTLRLIVVDIYLDKVSTFVAAKEKDSGQITVVDTAVEPQEGDVASNGKLNIERIKLNCLKALQALSPESRKDAKVIFGFGGGVSSFELRQNKITRKDRDQKITKEEVRKVVEDSLPAANEKMRENFPERFTVDGFVVPDPIGLNGKELAADVAVSLVDKDLEEALQQAASAYNLPYLGIVNISRATAQFLKSLVSTSDWVMVLIFQNNIDILIVKDKSITNIGNIDIGYGIIETRIADQLKVGREEAKDILQKFQKSLLANTVQIEIGEAIKNTSHEIVEKIKSSLGSIDKMRLLPASALIGISADFPILNEILSDKSWLSDLPMERNAEIQPLSDSFASFSIKIKNVENMDNVLDYALLYFMTNNKK